MWWHALVPACAALTLLASCDTGEPRVDGNGMNDAGDPPVGATHEYRVHEVVTGLEHPWGVAFLPGGDILITERPGRVRLVRDGALRPAPVAGAPSAQAGGQGGMLDIVAHPDFTSNRLVYISYSKPVDGGRTTAVARARWEGDMLVGLEDVFVADAASGSGQHFGSRLAFDPAGYLYITVGDRGAMTPSQDLSNHVGTTIRLQDDGGVPADNPFVDRAGVRPEIYSYGHRNAQGMAIHPETGQVWQTEHGPRGGDEVNRIQPGGNYGWPEARYADHYDGRPIPDYAPGDGFVAPLLDWTPALAPSGLAFYTGDRFPDWRGSLFSGGLVSQQIRRVVFDGTDAVHQEELLTEYGARIRDVRDGPDGYIYFLTDSANGVLARLEPAEG
jgi:aldose sugar dehydrogenase